jgi:hypothetical protein
VICAQVSAGFGLDVENSFRYEVQKSSPIHW